MTRQRRGGGQNASFKLFMQMARDGQRLRQQRLRQENRGGHKGGFGDPVHGSIDGKPVTAAFGWGTKEGHSLLADGHVNLSTFKQHGNHNHYGPGQGPHGNVKDRFQYSGPGH